MGPKMIPKLRINIFIKNSALHAFKKIKFLNPLNITFCVYPDWISPSPLISELTEYMSDLNTAGQMAYTDFELIWNSILSLVYIYLKLVIHDSNYLWKRLY